MLYQLLSWANVVYNFCVYATVKYVLAPENFNVIRKILIILLLKTAAEDYKKYAISIFTKPI